MKRKSKNLSFDEKIKQAKYERVYGTLKDILQVDIKDDKNITDYPATCSAIKTKARLALDFIKDLDKDEDD